jgi:hypothetical protein
LAESLAQNKGLTTVNVQHNHLYKIRDMKTAKGFDLRGTLQHIESVFKYLKEIRTLEQLLINDWLFDHLEYPDSLTLCIKEARKILSDKTAFNTISTHK